MDAALDDLPNAPIPDAEKALLEFVAAVNRRPSDITAAEVDAVRAHGWTDEALYDAISVCALFNFYNRWCDGSGVNPMPAEGHLASGRRLAERGYAPPEV